MLRLDEKIIADDHDTECSMRAGELIQLGFLGNEFAYYGIAYSENDTNYYYICEKEKSMMEFIDSALENDIFPSWIAYHNKRYQVPIGEYDTVHQKTKRDLAQYLKEQYTSDFHKAIVNCKNSSLRNTGSVIIKQFAREINSCFDEGLIQIYKGLAKDALLMCKIDVNQYKEAMYFSKHELLKCSMTEKKHSELHRTYYGFAIYDGEKTRLYSNATALTVYEKRQQMIVKGMIVSPIISKRYTGKDIFDLNQKKIEFEQKYLSSYFTKTFMRDLNLFWKMPSGVDIMIYMTWKNKLTHKSPISQQVFSYYGRLWGMEFD